jgi:hypothetical protein
VLKWGSKYNEKINNNNNKKMSLLAFTGGALFGIFVEVYSNGVRKLPLFANPRNHAIAAGVGGLTGVGIHSWQIKQKLLLAQELERLGKTQRDQ